MIVSTLTGKGQTTVPKKVREALGMTAGQRIQWMLNEDSTVTVRVESSALALFGSLKPSKRLSDPREEKAAVKKIIGAYVSRKDRKPA